MKIVTKDKSTHIAYVVINSVQKKLSLKQIELSFYFGKLIRLLSVMGFP